MHFPVASVRYKKIGLCFHLGSSQTHVFIIIPQEILKRNTQGCTIQFPQRTRKKWLNVVKDPHCDALRSNRLKLGSSFANLTMFYDIPTLRFEKANLREYYFNTPIPSFRLILGKLTLSKITRDSFPIDVSLGIDEENRQKRTGQTEFQTHVRN